MGKVTIVRCDEALWVRRGEPTSAEYVEPTRKGIQRIHPHLSGGRQTSGLAKRQSPNCRSRVTPTDLMDEMF